MVYMLKYISTIYKNFYKKFLDSTTNIIPNLQSTKSPPPPLTPSHIPVKKNDNQMAVDFQDCFRNSLDSVLKE